MTCPSSLNGYFYFCSYFRSWKDTFPLGPGRGERIVASVAGLFGLLLYVAQYERGSERLEIDLYRFKIVIGFQWDKLTLFNLTICKTNFFPGYTRDNLSVVVQNVLCLGEDLRRNRTWLFTRRKPSHY